MVEPNFLLQKRVKPHQSIATYQFAIQGLQDGDAAIGSLEIHRLDLNQAINDVLSGKKRKVLQIPPSSHFSGSVTYKGIEELIRTLPVSPFFNISFLRAEEFKRLELSMTHTDPQTNQSELCRGIVKQTVDETVDEEDYQDEYVEEWMPFNNSRSYGQAYIYPTAFNNIRWKITI